MATYGVSYGGRKNPFSYGVQGGSRSLASLYGSQSMQPLSAAKPQGFAPLAASTPAPLDALGRVMQNSQNVFQSIAPNTGYGLLNPGTTTPGSTTQTPSPPTPPVTPAPSSTYQGTDLSADPILNQIKALGQKRVGDSATGALAGSKNDLINYGGVDVPQQLRDLFAAQTPTQDDLLGALPANAILGALNDTGTAQAASANPFSTRAQLSQAHEGNQHAIDQTANLANLYYSSTHANQLGDENNAYLGAQNSALQSLAQALMGENTGELNAINSAHDQYLGELPNAYARALAAGGSGGTGGTGDGTTPPPPPGDTTTPPPPPTGPTGTNLDPLTGRPRRFGPGFTSFKMV